MKFILPLVLLFSILSFAQLKLKKIEVFTNLKITYSEPMDSSAINPENYKLYRIIAHPNAGLPIIPRSATFSNDTTVVLETSPQPPGDYRLDVSNVYDLSGNLIDFEHNSETYTKR